MTTKQQPYGIYHLHDPINNRTLKFHKPLLFKSNGIPMSGEVVVYIGVSIHGQPAIGAGVDVDFDSALAEATKDTFGCWDKGQKGIRKVAVMIEEQPE